MELCFPFTFRRGIYDTEFETANVTLAGIEAMHMLEYQNKTLQYRIIYVF